MARGGLRVEFGQDGEWAVRQVISDSTYRCPACQQIIPPGTKHIVAWRRDGWRGEAAGLEERRHWHTSCWTRRARLR